jgi:primase-polymerase (primpol)-like protein
MTSKANDTTLDTESRELQPENIPDILKALGRWAPWEAVWNVKRSKFDKIPKDARHPVRKISTSTPDRWFTFADSLTAFHQHPDKVHGIGFCITALQGFAFLDLDGCIDPAGVVAPWAQDVVNGAGSYTEISPSGRGLRIVVRVAESPGDWVNHDVGIEVYAGAEARCEWLSRNAVFWL